MDLSIFPPFALVLGALAQAVGLLGDLFTPLVGGAAPVLAIVALTILVRALVVPLGVLQVRADLKQRRLAPAIAQLRAKYARRPELLNAATLELYKHEKVSPIAAVLPTLAQAPVLSALYALFVHQQLAGQTNPLLLQTFAGVPLGSNLFALFGAAVSHLWVFVALLIVLTVVVELTRRANVRWARVASSAAASMRPGAVGMNSAALEMLARMLPFITVGFAAIAPFAAAVYVLTSAAWTVAEREITRRYMLTQA